MGGEIKATELQELAVVAEAAQVAGLGQDGERVDRPDAGNLLQAPEVGMLPEQLARHRLDRVALADQMPCLGDDEAEHGDRRGIRSDGQGDRAACGLIDVAEQAGLGDLAAGDVPCGRDEGVLAQGHDAGRHGEAFQQGEEPVAAGVVAEAVDLRDVEREVVCLDAVQDLGLGL